MVKQLDDGNQSKLKQLWGEFMPALTPEQADLSVKLWQKIQDRKQRHPKQDAKIDSQTQFDSNR
jgi:hypothetical protein